MKANELRIGNWVHHDSVNVIVESIEYDRCDLSTETEHGTYFRDEINEDEINPIPLTEEWVDKLNEKEFQFIGFGTRIIYQCVKYPMLKYELTRINQIAVYFGDQMINLKSYIHEWQNIHFALCGEELKIKQQ